MERFQKTASERSEGTEKPIHGVNDSNPGALEIKESQATDT